MSIPVLAYEEHSDIVGAADFIGHLADFADARGWNVVEEQPGYKWASIGGGLYGWVADATTFPESFLCLENVRGQQFRLQVIAMASGELHYVYIKGFDASSTWSTSSSTNPALQTTGYWGSQLNYRNPIPTEIYQKVWFFGDDDVIYVVIQFDSDFCLLFAFGTYDLVESTNLTDYGFILHSSYVTSSTGYQSTIAGLKGSNTYYFGGLDHTTPNYYRYKTDLTQLGSNAYVSFARTTGDYNIASVTQFKGINYKDICTIGNVHSSQFPLMRQSLTILDPTDGLWFVAGLYHAVRYQDESRAALGASFSVDTEEYISFPGKNKQTDYGRYAFRIA